MKSWEELARDAAKSKGIDLESEIAKKAIKAGATADQIEKKIDKTRASMDGQISRGIAFDSWLKGKSEAIQNDIFGAGRAKLWREGKATLSDMTNQFNRPLTFEQLRSR